MAFSISVHKDLDLVFTRYRGFVDTQQLVEAQSAVRAHPDYTPSMTELTELSDVTDTDLDFKSILSHAWRMANHYNGTARRTHHYIVAATDLGFGMARMYEAVAETDLPNMTLLVFRSEREALQSMGREETSITALLGAQATSRGSD